MTTLKAGDIRQKGDQYRHLDKSDQGYNCYGESRRLGYGQLAYRQLTYRPHRVQVGAWTPVRLIGHAILQSDLMIFEYQRL